MKIKIRGLAHIGAWIFLVWGSIITVKGFWDAFIGEPEANYFSPTKWEFVTQQQWLTWSGFEITYGLACIGIALLIRAYAPRLPAYITSST